MSEDGTTVGRGILVGVDGSERARHAAEWAARTAADLQEPLTICSVHSESGPPPTPGATPTRRPGEAVLQEATEAARAVAPSVPIDTVAAIGHPGAQLIELAQGRRFVVVGSHGHHPFPHMFAGSVAAQVAAHAPCPTAVVHAPGRRGGPVVIGLDGSDQAQRAAEAGFRAAAAEHLPVKAIHAYQLPALAVDYGLAPTPDVMTYYRDEATQVLNAALKPWIERYPEIKVDTESPFGPAGAVLSDASAEASLLVVGSRGRGGFRGLLLGSVSRHVVNTASCPVLVVR